MMFELNQKELATLTSLSSPIRIQNFLNSLSCNWETSGETNMSPRLVLRSSTAHCLEGALLAAAALLVQGKTPWLMDLKTSEGDDHVIALYKINGYWGALSKTNHATLRFRDPIYSTIHELALSYFHEYFNNTTGKKILESYSKPFNLNRYGTSWITSEENLAHIATDIDDSIHYELIPKENKKYIRRADEMEMRAGSLLEWRQNGKKSR